MAACGIVTVVGGLLAMEDIFSVVEQILASLPPTDALRSSLMTIKGDTTDLDGTIGVGISAVITGICPVDGIVPVMVESYH